MSSGFQANYTQHNPGSPTTPQYTAQNFPLAINTELGNQATSSEPMIIDADEFRQSQKQTTPGPSVYRSAHLSDAGVPGKRPRAQGLKHSRWALSCGRREACDLPIQDPGCQSYHTCNSSVDDDAWEFMSMRQNHFTEEGWKKIIEFQSCEETVEAAIGNHRLGLDASLGSNLTQSIQYRRNSSLKVVSERQRDGRAITVREIHCYEELTVSFSGVPNSPTIDELWSEELRRLHSS